jgi:hypothetical protein
VIHRYEAFGLAIRSNRPLPGLHSSETTRVDLDVEFVEDRAPEVDELAAATTASHGSGSIQVCGDGTRLLLLASHGGERAWSMRVSGDGRSIEVRWRGPIEFADIAAFVEVSGISTALALRGVPLLHACAVDTGRAAFLVLGPGGAGKSTVAAAAVAAGYPVLTDDIAAVGGSGADVHVHPGSRHVRINEDTASAFGWDPAELQRVFATPDLPPKLLAPASASNGALSAGARRVASIFVLGPRHAAPVTIDPLAPAEALAALLGNTFGDRVVDQRARAALLPFWTQVARHVPVLTVGASDDLASARSLVEALASAADR